MQTCKTCKKNFEIRPEDFVFYEQIKVPPPGHCPDCRTQRRISFRNERTLYKRQCNLCKKTVFLYIRAAPLSLFIATSVGGTTAGTRPSMEWILINPNLSWNNMPN